MATAETRPQFAIRPAREADAPALREIFNEAVEDGLATFDAAPTTLEEEKQRVVRAIESARCPLFVAEVRNWVCGSAAIEIFDTRRSMEEIGEVTIFVRRSFRSYGVGRQLMRAIQKEAARLGYRKLVGHMLADNHDSLRLCTATGWSVAGTFHQHARHGKKLRDVVAVEYMVPAALPAE
jgi:L-amino acid N-acyltransferase YncA